MSEENKNAKTPLVSALDQSVTPEEISCTGNTKRPDKSDDCGSVSETMKSVLDIFEEIELDTEAQFCQLIEGLLLYLARHKEELKRKTYFRYECVGEFRNDVLERAAQFLHKKINYDVNYVYGANSCLVFRKINKC